MKIYDEIRTRAQIFIQQMAALLKPNEMRRIKNVGIYNKGGLFNKAVREAIDEWRKWGGSGSA
jgi:hypothetical protein